MWFSTPLFAFCVETKTAQHGMLRKWSGHRVCREVAISHLERAYANPALMEDRDRSRGRYARPRACARYCRRLRGDERRVTARGMRSCKTSKAGIVSGAWRQISEK